MQDDVEKVNDKKVTNYGKSSFRHVRSSSDITAHYRFPVEWPDARAELETMPFSSQLTFSGNVVACNDGGEIFTNTEMKNEREKADPLSSTGSPLKVLCEPEALVDFAKKVL